MPGWVRQAAVAVAVGSFAIAGAPAQADTPVPKAFQGRWAAGGRCGDPHDRLIVSAATAALGWSPPAAITYAPNDDGAGHGALHWAAEGEVDNFVLVSPNGPLIHNAQGYGMPGQVAFQRCAR